jgi:hypothetical protein
MSQYYPPIFSDQFLGVAATDWNVPGSNLSSAAGYPDRFVLTFSVSLASYDIFSSNTLRSHPSKFILCHHSLPFLFSVSSVPPSPSSKWPLQSWVCRPTLCIRNTKAERTAVSGFLDLTVLLNMRNGFAEFVFAYFTALSLSKL